MTTVSTSFQESLKWAISYQANPDPPGASSISIVLFIAIFATIVAILFFIIVSYNESVESDGSDSDDEYTDDDDGSSDDDSSGYEIEEVVEVTPPVIRKPKKHRQS